jgi:hypothetical protein
MHYITLIGPPAIAMFLSGWLRDSRLPKWFDTTIAFLVVVLTAWVWALLAGKLAGDLPADTVIIAGYVAALIAGPMAPLHAWLNVKLPSPFSALAEEASSVYDVIQHNSMLAPGQLVAPWESSMSKQTTAPTPITESMPATQPPSAPQGSVPHP